MKKMTRLLLLLCCFLVSVCGSTQPGPIEQNDIMPSRSLYDADNFLLKHHMQQVDSFSHTPGIANHFAKIYTASMRNISVQLSAMDSGAQFAHLKSLSR